MMVVHRSHFYRHSCRAQRGAALLLAMFIIGLAVTALVMRSYDAAEMKARQEEKTMKALAEAKAALIAWSVAHPQWPGVMPFPDRSDDPEGYDGKSDCPPASATNFSDGLLIGQLPIYGQTTPCISPHIGIGGNWRDGAGNRIWYAVSRNLVRTRTAAASNLPIINPGILTAAGASSPYNGTDATKPHAWLKVVDANGNILSDRVAAVLIAPGAPIGNQNRTINAGVSHFLESSLNNNQTFVRKNQSTDFNDKLIYITIDELVEALAHRVVREIKNASFPENGLIRQCILHDTCQIDTALSWKMRGIYVSEGQPPASDQIDKQLHCRREPVSDALECSDKSQIELSEEDSKALSLTIPLDSSYLGLTMTMRNIEKLRAMHAVIEVKDKSNQVLGRIKPTNSGGMLEVSNANLMQVSKEAYWDDWFFQNEWGSYTDIVISPAMRRLESDCDSGCFTVHRSNGVIEHNVKMLILVRREGVGDIALPIVYESDPKFLAMYWLQ
ncbi:hypothetical protein [Methylobacillus flagellatus]|nr:hypothetical protein [Methylobacillus flagellatus]